MLQEAEPVSGSQAPHGQSPHGQASHGQASHGQASDGQASHGHSPDAPTVDWEALRMAARSAMERAYAPYSRFPVGAAAVVDDGRVVTGCNVENASYGLTLCAECGVISSLHASGGGRLVAFTCVGRTGAWLMPCGRCRQLLYEHGGAELLVDAAHGPVAMAQLLPEAFGAQDLV
jgi:cytidine deaminase